MNGAALFQVVFVLGFMGLTGYVYRLRDRRAVTGILVSLVFFLCGTAVGLIATRNSSYSYIEYSLLWGLGTQTLTFIPLVAFVRPRQRCPQCHAYTRMRAQHCHRCGHSYKPSISALPGPRQQAIELWRNTRVYWGLLGLMLVALCGSGLSAVLVSPMLRSTQDRLSTQGLQERGAWEVALPTPTPWVLMDVVVAAKDIPWGRQIEADMLEIATYPVDGLSQGTFSSSKDVIERYAGRDIAQGEMIFRDALTDDNPTLDAQVLPRGVLEVGQTYKGILDAARWMEEWSLSGQAGQQLSLNLSVMDEPIPILMVFQMPSEQPLMGEGRVINNTLTRVVTLPETGHYRVLLMRAGMDTRPLWEWYALTVLAGDAVIETTPQPPFSLSPSPPTSEP